MKVSESKLRVNVAFFFYLEQVTKYTGKVVLLRRIYKIFIENFVKNLAYRMNDCSKHVISVDDAPAKITQREFIICL